MNTFLHELTELILWINRQGWSPATSTNYSHRDDADHGRCYLSRSGIDKSLFQHSDFLHMTLQGELIGASAGQKPSAETGLHLMLYQSTDAQCIVHTHSKSDTLLSRWHAQAGRSSLRLSAYELLKGLRDIDTHETTVEVPIFANNQNIQALSLVLQDYLDQNPDCQGILIESHGFYTWGRSVAEAKRHLEVFQFLFDCELEWLKLSPNGDG